MSREVRKYYQVLKDKGDLHTILPHSVGDWEQDKVKFTKYYDENIKFIVDFENGTLDDEDHYFNDDEELY